MKGLCCDAVQLQFMSVSADREVLLLFAATRHCRIVQQLLTIRTERAGDNVGTIGAS
jgi:hypothetical protein